MLRAARAQHEKLESEMEALRAECARLRTRLAPSSLAKPPAHFVSPEPPRAPDIGSLVANLAFQHDDDWPSAPPPRRPRSPPRPVSPSRCDACNHTPDPSVNRSTFASRSRSRASFA